MDDTSEEEDGSEVSVIISDKDYDVKYSDYYQFIANSKAIRPICIAEDVHFENMSFGKKILWWLGSILKVLSILYL